MLIGVRLLVLLAASATHHPDLPGEADIQVVIEAPAMWAPDTRLLLELGKDRYEVAGSGRAFGKAPVAVRLVDAGSCRVLVSFAAQPGEEYVVRVGDVPVPTVTSRPFLGGGDAPFFEPSEFSGCDETSDAALSNDQFVAIAAATAALALGALVALRRAQVRK